MHFPENGILPYLCGTDEQHEHSFRIDRPCDPFDSVLFLHFRSCARILTINGNETAVPGDCIFHSPDFPQFHEALPTDPAGYRNDWIHIVPDLVLPLLLKYNLPCNTLLHTNLPALAASFIQTIQHEAFYAEADSGTMIKLILEQMILRISRSCRTGCLHEKQSRTERIYHSAMIKFRDQLCKHPEQKLSIRSAAKEMYLSPGRFTAIYRMFFRKTPYADLIDMRMEKARSLLATTSYQVKEIAALCGWEDAHFFMRAFHAKNGVTPSEFRMKFFS